MNITFFFIRLGIISLSIILLLNINFRKSSFGKCFFITHVPKTTLQNLGRMWYLIIPYNTISLIVNLANTKGITEITWNLFFISIGFFLLKLVESKVHLCEKGIIYCDKFIKWIDVHSCDLKNDVLTVIEKGSKRNTNIRIKIDNETGLSLKSNINFFIEDLKGA